MTAKSLIPILRSFDEAKAREFYIDFLGFSVTFEHRFAPTAPLYMGLQMDNVEIHLSEHFGDAAPGTSLRIEVDDVAGLNAQLLDKKYKNAGPGYQDQEWGMREMAISDPFGNKIIFCQPHESLLENQKERPS